ncbi:MAG: type II toxin-antitoxin system VapC family toxin [Candidatus Thorarchaeota archaeon]|nr:type II toxin-antitoxin system VapC family toxin [Candidatus Thorarchaeota archaeon]
MTTMRKIAIYLEASALWDLMYGEPGKNLVEYCLIENNEVSCRTSAWTRLELARAVQKRINQKEITKKEGKDLLEFIEVKWQQLMYKNQLVELQITNEVLDLARQFISKYNLYASDALHLASAIDQRCSAIIVDDFHFKRLKNRMSAHKLAIWSTTMRIDTFQKKFKQLT